VPESEVKAVAEALQSRFRQALDNGRLSQVLNSILHFHCNQMQVSVQRLNINHYTLCGLEDHINYFCVMLQNNEEDKE
jgi:hypothetical protein